MFYSSGVIIAHLSQNRRRAFQVLRARLMDRKLNQEMIERRDMRRSLVGSVDRSEKIRTYNYAQVCSPPPPQLIRVGVVYVCNPFRRIESQITDLVCL